NINADDLVVFRNDVSYHHKEALMIRSDVIHDPTLSRTTEYTCNNCPNHEAVFWQLPESQQTNAMALIFVLLSMRVNPYWLWPFLCLPSVPSLPEEEWPTPGVLECNNRVLSRKRNSTVSIQQQQQQQQQQQRRMTS
ncbi:DNA-directed RNA polymerase II subunit RPB9, partial [Perkinsus olseni]